MIEKPDAVDESQMISGDTIQAILDLKTLLEQQNVSVPIMGSKVVDVMLDLSANLDSEEIVCSRARLLQALPPSYQNRLHKTKQETLVKSKRKSFLEQSIAAAVFIVPVSLLAWYAVAW